MQLRYQYRVYPTPGQQDILARSFGCARVVFNDCLRIRQAAYASGVKLSDTAVQKQVVTAAKKTPERAWLGEVASVVLVQGCQDARRAYRNWFDSPVVPRHRRIAARGRTDQQMIPLRSLRSDAFRLRRIMPRRSAALIDAFRLAPPPPRTSFSHTPTALTSDNPPCHIRSSPGRV